MSFTTLGLADELVTAAEARGFVEPTPLQKAAVPVLRRGSNAVLLASTGAGVTAAYGLAILDRIREQPAGDAVASLLVLVPTDQATSRVANALAPLARAVGMRVAALAPDWAGSGGAEVVVGTPDALSAAVRASRVKLDALAALVLDGAGSILELAGTDTLENVLASTPREAQRVVTAAESSRALEDFLERHVRRALWIPHRPPEEGAAPPSTGTVPYMVLGEARKTAALARVLADRGSSGAVVYCRSPARADALRESLELRGLAGAEGASVTGSDAASGSDTPALSISYDVPFDPESLRRRHAAGGLVMLEPAELPHLRRIATDAGLALRAQDAPPQRLSDDVAAHRDLLRKALREQDLAAHLLVVEPLLEEFSAAEVAAAASALLRSRTPAPAPAAREPDTTGVPRSWARLFISIGKKDDVRPGDLVGAITGEAGIPGEHVGRVDIRDTFTVVEVAADAAERVIRALNGTSVRGRSLRVDYDRKPSGGSPDRSRAPARRAPPKRGGPRS